MGAGCLRSSSRLARGLLLAAFTAAAAEPLSAQGQEFACEYSRKVECTVRGCQDGEVGSAYLLVPRVDVLLEATLRARRASELPTIRRCDARGCSTVAVRVSLDGAFVNLTQSEGAYVLKISTVDLDDGTRVADFVEVATQSLSTVTYFGSCKGVVP